MSELTDYKAVLLDIEGTTTPVHFVYEVLFPYAQRELQNYLEQHWSDPNVQEDLQTLIEHFAQEPRDDKGRPTGEGEDQSNVEAFKSEVIERINWAIDNDKKHSGLKSLQGRIWRSGYQNGELKAPLFDDVPAALRTWNERGAPVYIYSSGSVEAQKLLFEYTEEGDLRDQLSGYFDTHTGNKKEADSYRTISQEIGEQPGDVLFVTDNLQEAEAANEAGMKVAVSKRPGNAELSENPFPVIESFEALV
ncbi:acireductone synthase [Persicimonas caeni]|uniref:Enolase-phosphatase E1 n=1 Tax=Persicimonas caeni TaxID=2292766 RepID=A0A4Y6PXU7_PERCE|nr:acireductone synthase [Persicimonas caeni]QDG53146.1 acireductone synthase [Persicimonas caeni]QED34368.1 acireductone synthase [Persicimonas caeni]